MRRQTAQSKEVFCAIKCAARNLHSGKGQGNCQRPRQTLFNLFAVGCVYDNLAAWQTGRPL
jgi:hypothetical protein